MPPLDERRCALYRHYDGDGRLLYVGIAISLHTRTAQHIDKSPWIRWVALSEAEWYVSKAAALKAERIAIQTERPIFNKDHNKGWELLVEDYLENTLGIYDIFV